MREGLAELKFMESGMGFTIPLYNNPIRQMQIDLVKQIKARERFKPSSVWGRNPCSIDVKIIVETKDVQLSWKTLDEKILLSEAILSIPLITKNTYGPCCDFKGWIMDVQLNSHFTFHVTNTMNGSDRLTGIEVYSDTIAIWRDTFPQELWVLYD